METRIIPLVFHLLLRWVVLNKSNVGPTHQVFYLTLFDISACGKTAGAFFFYKIVQERDYSTNKKTKCDVSFLMSLNKLNL